MKSAADVCPSSRIDHITSASLLSEITEGSGIYQSTMCFLVAAASDWNKTIAHCHVCTVLRGLLSSSHYFSLGVILPLMFCIHHHHHHHHRIASVGRRVACP